MVGVRGGWRVEQTKTRSVRTKTNLTKSTLHFVVGNQCFHGCCTSQGHLHPKLLHHSLIHIQPHIHKQHTTTNNWSCTHTTCTTHTHTHTHSTNITINHQSLYTHTHTHTQRPHTGMIDSCPPSQHWLSHLKIVEQHFYLPSFYSQRQHVTFYLLSFISFHHFSSLTSHTAQSQFYMLRQHHNTLFTIFDLFMVFIF